MIRTQAERHWIQIEAKPDGEDTGAITIDLNMVDKVDFMRARKSEDIDYRQVVVTYAGIMKPLNLFGDQAQFFMEKWFEFVKIHGAMDAAKPGLIQTVRKLPGEK